MAGLKGQRYGRHEAGAVRNCAACLYVDMCSAHGLCEHYTVDYDLLSDDPDGSAADDQRRDEYEEFVEAWCEYVNEYE